MSLVLGSTAEPLVIGCDFPGGNEYFRGGMRDVRVYGRALPAGEIAALAAPIPGLAGWWPLGERTSAIYDLSGHENHGSVQNGIMWTNGLHGPAMYLNGSNAYARCGSGKHDAAAVRLRNASRGGVEARLQEQESADQTHHYENLGWVAIEPGAGDFLAARTPAAVLDQPYGFLFETAFTGTPVLVGQAQTYASGDPVVLRVAALGPEGATVFLQEETSKDSETTHGAPESVGYAALPGDSGNLSAVPDADGDGISNAAEFLRASDPHDGDGDLDGLLDDEEYLLGTNPRSADTDGDGIPDAWEVDYGFNPTNAPVYDADHDGLSNLEEYEHGTNPLLADSDGDGFEDGLELRGLLTDPLAVNQLPVEVVLNVAGNEAAAHAGSWIAQPDGLTGFQRGYAEYTLSIATAGVYLVELDGRAPGCPSPTNSFPLRIEIDDEIVGGARTLVTTGTDVGTLRILAPHLTAGDHTLRVHWDRRDRTSVLQIAALRVLAIAGEDSDADTLPDWAERWLGYGEELFTGATSCVSPVCVEGESREPAGVLVDDLATGRAAGSRWYADVPLSPTSDTAIAISTGYGAIQQSLLVRWVPLNVLQETNLAIRAGDSLLLAAWDAETNGGPAFIEVQGVTSGWAEVTSPLQVSFDEAGAYQIVAALGSLTNALNLEVVSGSFSSDPLVWPGRIRRWDCPNLPTNVIVTADGGLGIVELPPPSGGGRRFNLSIDAAESRWIDARLGAGGPILDTAEARGITVLSSIQTYLHVIDVLPDGTRIVEMAVIVSVLDPGLTVRMPIFVGGVTFDDGSTTKTLGINDFDEFGVCRVRFIYPRNQPTSTCHRLYVYQDGVLVGER